jgi:glycosyltransferase involved in cell wall biosynthesis
MVAVNESGYRSTANLGDLSSGEYMSKPFADVLVSEPPGERLEACITVPAKDEEELLPSALRALAEQKTACGQPLSHHRYEVILLINNTNDRSRQVAEQFQRLYPTFRLHIVERNFDKSHSHNGYVRRLLMDEACRRLEIGGSGRQLILTTDADSQVAPNWISRNQEEFAKGAEAVAGRIVILPGDEAFLDPATRAAQKYDHLYRRLVAWLEDHFDPQAHDPWPRHHQHFGASLAISPRAYRLVGRLPPRRYFEDIAFYQTLIQHDVRLRHSNSVRVFTSPRLTGRAPFGLSRELNEWQACGNKGLRVPVECREFLEYLFTARRRFRLMWLDRQNTRELSARRVRELSRDTGLNPARIVAETRAARYFGLLLDRLEFYEVCRNQWPERRRVAPMKDVVDELQAAFRIHRRPGLETHRAGTRSFEAVGVSANRNGSSDAHRSAQVFAPMHS